jgi:hypothetical protein
MEEVRRQLAELESLGFSYKKLDTTSSSGFEINGISVAESSSFGVRYEWTLPRQATFQAVFGPESFGKKLVKIFRKEIQMDDALFDDAVYVSTSDEENTRAFLGDQITRENIAALVGDGGNIVVESGRVLYSISEVMSPAQGYAMVLFVKRAAGI